MKVDFSANINMYRKNAESLKAREQSSAPGNKVDVDDISRGKSAGVDKCMVSTKACIIGDVNQNATAARLSELTAQIKNGEYYVDSDMLAAAILDLDA